MKKLYWNDKGRKTLFLICLAISFLAVYDMDREVGASDYFKDIQPHAQVDF